LHKLAKIHRCFRGSITGPSTHDKTVFQSKAADHQRTAYRPYLHGAGVKCSQDKDDTDVNYTAYVILCMFQKTYAIYRVGQLKWGQLTFLMVP